MGCAVVVRPGQERRGLADTLTLFPRQSTRERASPGLARLDPTPTSFWDEAPRLRYGRRMLTAPSAARALADDFVAYRLLTEHDRALWAGELTHLEMWPDVSEQGVADRFSALEHFAQRGEVLEAADADDRTLLETIVFTGRSQSLQLRWQPELEWVNHTTGIFPTIFTFLPRYPLVTADDGDRYLEKIRRLPDFIDAWGGCLSDAADQSLTPISHLVSSLIAALDRRLERPLSEGQLARQSPPSSLAGEAIEAFTGELRNLLDDAVTSPLRRLRSTLASRTLPAARPDHLPGLVHLEGGPEHYERLVWAHTSLDVTASQVHEIGLQQVDRLESEYRQVAGPLLGTTDITEYLPASARRPRAPLPRCRDSGR